MTFFLKFFSSNEQINGKTCCHTVLKLWCYLRFLWMTTLLSLFCVWRMSLPSAAHGKWQTWYWLQKIRLNIASMTSKGIIWHGKLIEDISCVNMCCWGFKSLKVRYSKCDITNVWLILLKINNPFYLSCCSRQQGSLIEYLSLRENEYFYMFD